MKLNELKKKLLSKDAGFRKAYFKEDLAFGVSRLISNIRAYEEIDQAKLAKLLDTHQSAVSRLERGKTLPSLTMIDNIARVLNYKIKIKLISKKTGSSFDSDGMINIIKFNNFFESNINNFRNDVHTVVETIQSPYFTSSDITKLPHEYN